MTPHRVALVGILLGATLSACSPQRAVTSSAASVAVSETREHVSPATVDRLQRLCTLVQPVADRAAASTSRTKRVAAEFGIAYCGTLAAGVVPATTDMNTERWLQGIIREMRG